MKLTKDVDSSQFNSMSGKSPLWYHHNQAESMALIK